MNDTFLEKIFAAKQRRVDEEKQRVGLTQIKRQALERRSSAESFRLSSALYANSKINIIAEIKRASPSKGVINDTIDISRLALAYECGGACAISVLTEEQFFNGSLDDLKMARAASSLPILRKDFIFDDFQIYEAAAAGADAILLIAAMLDDERLLHLRDMAENELGLDALIEVHTAEELDRVSTISPKLIGVNNRDLRTFEVSLDVSRRLVRNRPDGALMIAESGIQTREDIQELRGLGYTGFLIGETLMRSGNVESELQRLSPMSENIVI